MKKLKLMVMLAVMLVITLMMAGSAYASAEWEKPDPNAEYPVLALGDSIDTGFDNENSLLTYKITPAESGMYSLSSAGSSDVCARLLDDSLEEVSSDDDSGDSNNFMIFVKLEKNKTYYLQMLTYGGLDFTLSMGKSAIEAISYIPFKPYTVKEHTNGFYDYDSGEDKLFIYSLPSAEADDVLIVKEAGKDPVIYRNKRFYDYDEDEYYYDFVDAELNHLPFELSFSSNQYEEPWRIGVNNYYAEYMGVTASIKATVSKNEVSAISFEPSDPYTLVENELGALITDDSGEWFEYKTPSFRYGDVLTVTDTEGNMTRYMCNDEDDEYTFYEIDEEDAFNYNNYIDNSSLLAYSDQASGHWTIEGPNSFTIAFEGKTCDVPVTIIENDVESISFEKADGTTSYSINEADSDHGYWDYDNFYYEVSFQVGDKLTINYKSGESTTYTWNEEEDEDGDYYEFFADDEGNRISGYDVDFYTIPNQREELWEPGNTYSANIKYKGRTLETAIPVTINEGSLEDVISEANSLLEAYEALNSTAYTSDSWEYFSNCKMALQAELENTEHSYVSIRKEISYLKDAYDRLSEAKFMPVDPETAKVISDGFKEDVDLNPDYRTATYKFECEEDGKYTFTSISVSEGGDAPDTYGRMLVYDEDAKDYVEVVENDDDGGNSQFFFTFEGEAGKVYWLQARLYDISETGLFTVSFSKDHLTNVKYVCASEKKYEQYLDGYIQEDYDYVFTITLKYEVGDRIELTYDNGDIKKYVYQAVDEDYYAFVNVDDTNDVIDKDDIDVDSDQRVYDEEGDYRYVEWEPGDHEFILTYERHSTTVPVTIVPSGITAIDFVPSEQYEIPQNSKVYGYLEDEETEPFFYYNIPAFGENDKLLITRNGEIEEYVYDGYDEFGCNDLGRFIGVDSIKRSSDQYDNHWMPDKENYFTLEYLGKAVRVPVIINSEYEETARALEVEDARALLDSAEIKDVKEEDYSEKSYKAFAEAKVNLEDAIKDDSGKTSIEISLLKQALVKAKDNLKTQAEQDAEDRINAVISAYVEITKVKALKAEEYTEDSYKAVTDAKAALEEVLDNTESNTTDIITATQNLTTVIDGLVAKEQVDPEEAARAQAVADAQTLLNSDDIKNVKEADYTDDTYTAFAEAKKALEDAIKDDSGKNSEAIKELTTALNTAKDNLKTKAAQEAEDRAEAVKDANTLLNSDDIKNVKEADYTDDTYTAFAEAKKALEDAIKDDSGKTSDEIKALTAALNTAKSNLKTKAQAEKEAAAADADTAIKAAAALKADDYTEDTYKAVTNAKTALETVLAKADSTAEDIKTATKTLNDAIDNLKTKAEEAAEKEAAAKTEAVKDANTLLNSDDIKNVKEDDYTADTYKAFSDAKKALEDAVKDDSGKTSDEIKALTAALNTAKSNLKTKAEEAAEKEAAAKAEAVKDANTELGKANAVDGAAYTDASYKTVTDAKATLEAALADSNSTSEDIKKATKALTDALAGLKTKEQEAAEQEAAAKAAAKTAADKAIADAAALNEADYTEESYKAVADAKTALEAALAKADAKAADITAATKTLTDAIAALEKIPAVADGDVVTVSGSSYVVTSTAKLMVALKKAKNVKSMTIPATVKLADGKSYKVTQVNGKSFTGNKIKAVTVGKNVKKLAKNAFKSSKATKITLKTKLLKKSGVKGSLKGSKVKKVYVKVGSKKVNKKTVKAYKKIFTKKIAGKKVAVK